MTDTTIGAATGATIGAADGVFRLDTATVSYWFRATRFGHLEHLYFGPRLPRGQDAQALALKRTAEVGASVVYDPAEPLYTLDQLPLEWSGTGRGDYRISPIEVELGDGSSLTDFTHQGHEVIPGAAPLGVLPSAHDDGDADVATLRVDLADAAAGLELSLFYTVFPAADTIARRVVLANTGDRAVTIRRLASLHLDLPNRGFRLITLDGAWIREARAQDQPLGLGCHVNSSLTGSSSHRHNPGFLLAERDATEGHGRVYAFNLVYSGNHEGAVERSAHDLVRVRLGVNPDHFAWRLGPGESFETPQAVVTASDLGLNGASQNCHRFVDRHIVRGRWQRTERPVLYNNWEATFFDFTAKKLLGLAKEAKGLGVELFVLDDGWFGKRDSDTAGLGDYTVNRRKFPKGLAHFADQIHSLGLKFGLWVEPEMVNRDSDLYRAHPEYAVTTPGRAPVEGRRQLVLDLTQEEVRDHIVENVGRVLDETKADYVKWDFNRHLADAYSPTLADGRQGEFFHRYALGLYDVLRRVFDPRPHILFESCSSGGNRMDLGMMCFSPQVWASDDTDPGERLRIQGGFSLLYPPSVLGAHVSDAPHKQTLRQTPLSTRFNVAAFGNLGYELDITALSPVQKREIKEQIAWYKAHRATLQFGVFHRVDRGAAAKANKVGWVTVAADGHEAVAGLFQTLAEASEGYDRLVVPGLDPGASYRVRTKPQSLFISQFGGLINELLPIALNPEGKIMATVDRRHRLTDAVEDYEACGVALADGLPLANQFMGSAYNDATRLLGDFGSTLYLVSRVDPGAGGQGAAEGPDS